MTINNQQPTVTNNNDSPQKKQDIEIGNMLVM